MFISGKKHRRIVTELQFVVEDLQQTNQKLAKELLKVQAQNKVTAVKKAVKKPVKKETK